jgi:CheY-like chemotaxis protein
MDCELPEHDIAETVHQIRVANVSQRPVPIIALTEADVPDARERCLAAGMNDQLAKPVSFFDLHALLARWLQPA